MDSTNAVRKIGTVRTFFSCFSVVFVYFLLSFAPGDANVVSIFQNAMVLYVSF